MWVGDRYVEWPDPAEQELTPLREAGIAEAGIARLVELRRVYLVAEWVESEWVVGRLRFGRWLREHGRLHDRVEG